MTWSLQESILASIWKVNSIIFSAIYFADPFSSLACFLLFFSLDFHGFSWFEVSWFYHLAVLITFFTCFFPGNLQGDDNELVTPRVNSGLNLNLEGGIVCCQFINSVIFNALFDSCLSADVTLLCWPFFIGCSLLFFYGLFSALFFSMAFLVSACFLESHLVNFLLFLDG